MERLSFKAMGTTVEVLLEAAPSASVLAALAGARAEFERLEAVFSRFRAESELSRLNETGSIDASDDLREVVQLALAARRRTGGRFDPTLHDAVVAAGYDRSFEELDERAPAVTAEATRGRGQVSVRGRRIELGAGVRLDLGGIVKGFAADRCARRLSALGACLVNAGGDLSACGVRRAGPWPVAVRVPRLQLTLTLAQGGLATSGRDRRRWRRDGEERHHLIDPYSGRPAAQAPLSVTVAADSATEAEVLAKSLFFADDPEREAERLRLPAVIVTGAGEVRLLGGLA
jgi:thiamine biosynthesis lipoprotein